MFAIKSKCEFQNQATHVCTNSLCNSSSLTCSNQMCKYHESHELCSSIKLQKLLTTVLRKDPFLNDFLNKIKDYHHIIEDAREQILRSKLRQMGKEGELLREILMGRCRDVESKQIKEIVNKLNQTSAERCSLDQHNILISKQINLAISNTTETLKTQLNNILNQYQTVNTKQDSQLQARKHKQQLSLALYNISKSAQIKMLAIKDQVHPELTINLIPQITTLILGNTFLSSIKIITTYCKSLYRLHLTINPSSFKQSLQHLSTVKRINELVIDSSKNPFSSSRNQQIEFLAQILPKKFEHLKALGFTGAFQYNHFCLVSIMQNMPKLESFGQSCNLNTDIDYEYLFRNVPQLKKLSFKNGTIDVKHLNALKQIKQLTIGHFSGVDEMSEKILAPELQKLQLKYLKDDNIRLMNLSFKKLKSLKFGQTIMDDFIPLMSPDLFSSLQQLFLNQNYISVQNIEYILGLCPLLKTLDLSYLNLSTKTNKSIVQIVCNKNKHLKRLSIEGFPQMINFKEIQLISQSLLELKQLIFQSLQEPIKDEMYFCLIQIKKMKYVEIFRDGRISSISTAKLIRNKRSMLLNRKDIADDNKNRKNLKNLRVMERESLLFYEQRYKNKYTYRDGLYQETDLMLRQNGYYGRRGMI